MGARLDQHYLVDENIRDSILVSARLSLDLKVLEIGPGRGFLTSELIGRTADLTVVEMDPRLADWLSQKFGSLPGFTLLRSDFLKIDLPSLGKGPFRIVANLPYSVGTPILQKILEWDDWSDAVLMFQKEVADRITAQHGCRDYGILTLSVLLRAVPELLFDVDRESFRPRPKVQSAVIRVTRLAEPRISRAREKVFFRIAKAAFGQRRKIALGVIAGGMSVPKEKVARIFEDLGIEPKARAENIPFETYLALAKAFAD